MLSVAETGHAGVARPDEDVLRFAIAAGRAVLTLNRRHFLRLHSLMPNHAGIIVCTVDPDFAGQAARIHGAIGQRGSLNASLVRVYRPSST